MRAGAYQKGLAFAFVLASAWGLVAEEQARLSELICTSDKSCTIGYEALIGQDDRPFMWSAKIMDEKHPQWPRYKRALRKYPNVENCLTKDDDPTDTPNLLNLNWRKLGSREIEVCAFRILASLKTFERIEDWFEWQGFEARPIRSLDLSPRRRKKPNATMYTIEGHWTPEQSVAKLGIFRLGVIFYPLTRSVWLKAGFNKDRELVSVSFGGNSKLN